MNERAEWKSSELACSDALKQLLARHSVGPKHLVPPAPTEERVWLAVGSALRAPDHQKLLPFRFVLIPDAMRPLLGELFADFARRSGKPVEEVVIERSRAMLGPLLPRFCRAHRERPPPGPAA